MSAAEASAFKPNILKASGRGPNRVSALRWSLGRGGGGGGCCGGGCCGGLSGRSHKLRQQLAAARLASALDVCNWILSPREDASTSLVNDAVSLLFCFAQFVEQSGDTFSRVLSVNEEARDEQSQSTYRQTNLGI